MPARLHKLITALLSLLLPGILSTCTLVTVALLTVPVGPSQMYAEPGQTGKNHYEPVILASNENMIRIKYLSVGPNAEHEQVRQLMSDHCHGAYIETSRVELRGYDTVEAECTHDTVSIHAGSGTSNPTGRK